MAWMMEPASLIFLTDVALLFSKSVHFNATIYFCLSVCCVIFYYSQHKFTITIAFKKRLIKRVFSCMINVKQPGFCEYLVHDTWYLANTLHT